MSQGFTKFSIYNHNNTKRDKNDPVVFDMEMDGQFYLIHKTQSLVKDITGICTIIALLPRVRQTSDISHTLVGNKNFNHSDIVGASPVYSAQTTSSFST